MTITIQPRPGKLKEEDTIETVPAVEAEFVCHHCSGTGFLTSKQQHATKKPPRAHIAWLKKYHISVTSLVLTLVLFFLLGSGIVKFPESQLIEDIKACSPYVESSPWDKGNCNCLRQRSTLNPSYGFSYKTAIEELCSDPK